MSSGRFYLSRLYRPSRRRFSSFRPLLYSPDDSRLVSNPSSGGHVGRPAIANIDQVEEESISFQQGVYITVRRYQPPNAVPDQHILYFPPPHHQSFPPRDLLSKEFVARRIAAVSSTTVIAYELSQEPLWFPGNLHTLLAIHDKFIKLADPSRPPRVALLSAGLSAPLAAAMAATENGPGRAIHAQGIWFGVLDLTEHITGVAYSPSMRRWKFFNPPCPKLEKPEYRLGMSIAELTLLRMRMFKRPEMWTDPFASPMQLFMNLGVSCDSSGPAPLPLRLYFPQSYRRRSSFKSGIGEDVVLPTTRIVVPANTEPDEVGLLDIGQNYTHGARRFARARWLEGEGKLIPEGPDSEAALAAKNATLIERYKLIETSADRWESEVHWMGHWLSYGLGILSRSIYFATHPPLRNLRFLTWIYNNLLFSLYWLGSCMPRLIPALGFIPDFVRFM